MRGKKKIRIDVQKCAQCLLCQLMCSFIHTGSFNISQSRIHIDVSERQIDFSDECDQCGICTHYCGYGALVMENEQGEVTHEGI